MGDRTTVRIEIGGRLPIEKLSEFVKLCEAEDLKFDWCDQVTGEAVTAKAQSGDSLDLGAYEVNYGNMDELEAWLQEHGLRYYKTWDRGGSYGAGGELYDEQGLLSFSTDGDSDQPLLTVDQVCKTPLAELMALCDRLTNPVPAIELIGADGPIDFEKEA